MTQAAVQPVLVRRAALLDRLVGLDMVPGTSFDVEALSPGAATPAGWDWLPKSARESGTGMFLISESAQGLPATPRTAIAPPFPITTAGRSSFDDIRSLLTHTWTVGVILLRLGHYAVGVATDERLISSKTGARYVKNRQRQGGQSATRFVRSREKWIQQLFGEAGEVARSRFEEFQGHIDWLALGGDRQVLARFMKRVKLPGELSGRVLPWLLPVERPGRAALDAAIIDAWSSRTYESPARRRS